MRWIDMQNGKRAAVFRASAEMRALGSKYCFAVIMVRNYYRAMK
jgi:hypothetical protein